MAVAIEHVQDVAAWIRGEVPAWAFGVRYTAAHSLRTAVGDPYGQPFEYSPRYAGMRLMRAIEDGRAVGFALYERSEELAKRHLHHIARDPGCKGRRINAALFRAVLDAMRERPILPWPITQDGRLALIRWESLDDEAGEWQYWEA
ncbi:MAG TPA: GNAT family N-acetyltransferase [Candidatus Polarisedimenticolaceae bacterium]|nr:GNAT family N-acetyltransferase [Candidatus Polarisedimenticolaceae bacterium]